MQRRAGLLRGLLLFCVAMGPCLVLLGPMLLGGEALSTKLGRLARLARTLEPFGLPERSPAPLLTLSALGLSTPLLVWRYTRRRFAICALSPEGFAQRGVGSSHVHQVPAAQVLGFERTPHGYEVKVRGRSRALEFLSPLLIPADARSTGVWPEVTGPLGLWPVGGWCYDALCPLHQVLLSPA
ncbi:MAG: hypothetical protein R3F62_31045 [Planctomycetota bacterium]